MPSMKIIVFHEQEDVGEWMELYSDVIIKDGHVNYVGDPVEHLIRLDLRFEHLSTTGEFSC